MIVQQIKLKNSKENVSPRDKNSSPNSDLGSTNQENPNSFQPLANSIYSTTQVQLDTRIRVFKYTLVIKLVSAHCRIVHVERYGSHKEYCIVSVISNIHWKFDLNQALHKKNIRNDVNIIGISIYHVI